MKIFVFFFWNLQILIPEFVGVKFASTATGTSMLEHLVSVSKNVTFYGTGDWFLSYLDRGVIIQTSQLKHLKHQIGNKKVVYHVMNQKLMPAVIAYNVVNEKIYYR